MPTNVHARLHSVGLTSFLGTGKAANLAGVLNAVPQYQQHTLQQFGDPLQAAYLKIDLPVSVSSARERMFHLLDTSLGEALEDAGLQAKDRAQMPVFIGSSSYGIAIAEESYQASLASMEPGNAAQAVPILLDGFAQISERLQNRYGFRGTDFSYNTACTSSANAILAATQSIHSGQQSHALVIGLETFNLTTLAGFAGMQLLANDVMRPFDRRRNGLVLGEGCAALLFKAASHDEGLTVRGGATQCDTYSISASNPDGSAIAGVMTSALRDAGITAKDISAVKAHGTASPLNDTGEAAAMHQVFGEIPPFFCLKPVVGHTLGACGAIEFALLASALGEGIIPASAGFEEADSDLNANPVTHSQTAASGFYLLNFFGFGGNNCSIIIGHNSGSKPLQ